MSRKKRRNKRKLKPKSRARGKIIKSNNPDRLFFEIKLDSIPAGYVMNACKPGEQVEIVLKEFRSSEDGDLFISRLEGFPRQMLNLIRQKYNLVMWESSIGNMVSVIRKDKTVSLYINVPTKVKMQMKVPRSIEAGTPISRNDISDIQEMVFEGVDIPKDAGVFMIFSAGWRRGLYFDFTPLPPHLAERDYDINLVIGSYYSYLLFRDRFKLSDSDWENLFRNQWFPFISLSEKSISDILSHNINGWNIDDLLPQIKDEVLAILPEKLRLWENIEAFKPHIRFFQEAYEQYKDEKDISCISVLFPRIEGVIRTFQTLTDQPERPDQQDLAKTVISDTVNAKHIIYSPLLPLKFNKYLAEVYFSNFDPTEEDNPLSRNTVCHGIASEELFSLKASTLGFLILSQLAYYFSGIGVSKEGDNKQ